MIRGLGAVPRRADGPLGFLAMRGRHRLRGSISQLAIDSISSAIRTHEGWYPGSVSWRNNNPGNLVFAGQLGASRGDGGFARFNSVADGEAALRSQIALDASRGADVNGRPIVTLADLIASWAPASDPRNNTAAYVSAVAAETGYDPNAPLSALGTADYHIDVYLPAGGGASSDGSLIETGGYSGASGDGAESAAFDFSGSAGESGIPLWWLLAGVGGLVVLGRLTD